MADLPYKIATLLYAFDAADRVLLLRRRREPNAGLWSPPGGKLETQTGESPHACAAREAREELGLIVTERDLRMVGMVSERAYQASAHWLIFLFELTPRMECAPPDIEEGSFAFFSRAAMKTLAMPRTDRERIWPLFWDHRHGFFAAHCDSEAEEGGGDRWLLLESHRD